MVPPLGDQAERFALTLAEIVNGTVCDGERFVVTPLRGAPFDLVWIFPEGSTPTKRKAMPIVSSPGLWLKVWYQCRLDDRGRYLAVHKSGFVLCTDGVTGRPVLRLEYDRDGGSEPDQGVDVRHRRSAAHVHIHGTSQELDAAQAAAGSTTIRPLHDLHVPVGGRRYRPSLEDFIEFLIAEELVREPRPGWPAVIDTHREIWLRRQLKASVRRDPEAAIAALRDEGLYPTDGSGTPAG